MFAQVPRERLHAFDAACRKRAIELAAEAGIPDYLSINKPPDAITLPDIGLSSTVETARTVGFPVDRLMIELTERREVHCYGSIKACLARHRAAGLKLGLDDFGSGYNSIHRVVELDPDFIKLDRKLTNAVVQNENRQRFLTGLVSGCRQAGIGVVAEGLETASAVAIMRKIGVSRMQGYYFGKPTIGHFPQLRDDA